MDDVNPLMDLKLSLDVMKHLSNGTITGSQYGFGIERVSVDLERTVRTHDERVASPRDGVDRVAGARFYSREISKRDSLPRFRQPF